MEKRIKIAGYQPEGSILSQSLNIFGKSLANKTPNIKTEFTFNIMDIGKAPEEIIKLVSDGVYDVGYISSSYFAKKIPELYIFDIPFLIKNRQQAYNLIESPYQEQISAEVSEKYNLTLLSIWDYGFRHFSNHEYPIKTLADCKGLLFRTLLNDLHLKMFASLGFKAEMLQVSEYLSRIKSGEKIAQENALTNFYNFQLHHYHRYLSITNHLLGMALLICNKNTFSTLTTEQKKQFLSASSSSATTQRELAIAEEKLVLEKLKNNGVLVYNLSDNEKAAFKKALSKTALPFRDKIGTKALEYLEITN